MSIGKYEFPANMKCPIRRKSIKLATNYAVKENIFN